MSRGDAAEMQISENFWLREALRSRSHPALQTFHGDLTLGQTLMIAQVTHEFLQPIRNMYERPVHPSSWVRSLELDRRVGGTSKRKTHLTGGAVDFVVEDIPFLVVLRELSKMPEGIWWDRLCLYVQEQRFHVDTRPWEVGQPRRKLYLDWVEVTPEEAYLFATSGSRPQLGGDA